MRTMCDVHNYNLSKLHGVAVVSIDRRDCSNYNNILKVADVGGQMGLCMTNGPTWNGFLDMSKIPTHLYATASMGTSSTAYKMRHRADVRTTGAQTKHPTRQRLLRLVK